MSRPADDATEIHIDSGGDLLIRGSTGGGFADELTLSFEADSWNTPQPMFVRVDGRFRARASHMFLLPHVAHSDGEYKDNEVSHHLEVVVNIVPTATATLTPAQVKTEPLTPMATASATHDLIDGEMARVPVIADYRARWVEVVQVDVLINQFRLAFATVIIRANRTIRLSDYSDLKPDVALLRPYANFYRRGHSYPDEVMLIVEVLRGGGEYDGNMKVSLYAKAGVPELWLVNLEEDCIRWVV